MNKIITLISLILFLLSSISYADSYKEYQDYAKGLNEKYKNSEAVQLNFQEENASEEVESYLSSIENTDIYENDVETIHKNNSTNQTLKKEDIFCLDGSCHDASYKPNEEMLNALGGLRVLEELEKESDKDNISIFRGVVDSCKKGSHGSNNCCDLSGGWANDLAIAHCTKAEKDLKRKRLNNQCHYVGKKGSTWKFCCFESTLGKIIQEQGRGQLGLNFGNARSPICRGLTLNELTKINLDKVSFTELEGQYKKQIPASKFQELKAKIKSKLSSLTKGVS